MDSPDKIQWHPAFCATTELELQENIEELELIPEYNLSKKPIRIDLLIIKNSDKVKNIKNQIGHIMRKHNVIEYKNPNDGMNIDDFYKTIGYACLYKGYSKKANQILSKELTISLFRAAYPRELFLELEKEGHTIEKKYSGIYYVTENLPFPAQIIVTSELNKEMHSSLRILSDRADIDDIRRFLNEAQNKTSPEERNNIDSVLQASVSANIELYRQVRKRCSYVSGVTRIVKG
jgi:hypothetical protein